MYLLLLIVSVASSLENTTSAYTLDLFGFDASLSRLQSGDYIDIQMVLNIDCLIKDDESVLVSLSETITGSWSGTVLLDDYLICDTKLRNAMSWLGGSISLTPVIDNGPTPVYLDVRIYALWFAELLNLILWAFFVSRASTRVSKSRCSFLFSVCCWKSKDLSWAPGFGVTYSRIAASRFHSIFMDAHNTEMASPEQL